MRREQAALLFRLLVAILQRRQERDQAVRRIAGLVRQRDALLVRLVLFGAAEAAFDDVVVGGGDGALASARSCPTAFRRRPSARPCSSGSRGSVCFSVTWMISCAEHAGQLRFVLDQRERAARDVHVAAGRGERVDAVGVEHDERPRQGRARAALRQREADQADVAVHGGVLHDAVARADLAR